MYHGDSSLPHLYRYILAYEHVGMQCIIRHVCFARIPGVTLFRLSGLIVRILTSCTIVASHTNSYIVLLQVTPVACVRRDCV